MSCQSTILEDLEGRRSVQLQEGENNELILSTSQNPQMMPESDSEVDDIPDSKPEETLNEGSVQSDGNDQTSPLPVTAEPSPVTTETTEATETTASDKQIDETSDESFILEFARLCANRPGERSWLTRIQRKLPSQMRPLFPLLLERSIEKLHDYERNENTLPPALSHALIAGSCLCFSLNPTLDRDIITPKLPILSSDYKNDPLVPKALATLSCFRFLSPAQIELIIQKLQLISFPQYEILVREGERTDFLLIFLEGSVQKMKRSKLCPPDCDPSLKNYSYGRLIPGCVFGDRSLLTPSTASCSLFSVENGSLLRLSRNDYMNILSLGEEGIVDGENILSMETSFSSLFASSQPDGTVDSLYDMHSVHSYWTHRNADSLDSFIHVCCSGYSTLQEASADYACFERLLNGLKSNRMKLDGSRRFCEQIQAQFAFTSVCLFVLRDNTDMQPIQWVGEAMNDHFVLKMDERYCTVTNNQSSEHHSFPILLNEVTVGVLHTICSTNSPEVSQLSTQQETMLRTLASALGPFMNTMLQQSSPEAIAQELSDDCKVQCIIESIALQKASFKQFHYVNNSLKIAAFHRKECISEYRVISVENCDHLSINRALQNLCGNPITTSISINKCNLSTMFYIKLVLGSTNLIGMIPLFSSDCILQTGKQVIRLYPEECYQWATCCGWQYDRNCAGTVSIEFTHPPSQWVLLPSIQGYDNGNEMEGGRMNDDYKALVTRLNQMNQWEGYSMSEGECIAIQRCPELLKECKNAPLRLCEAVNNGTSVNLTRCYSLFPELLCYGDLPESTSLESQSLSHHSSRLGNLLLLLGHRNRDIILREHVCDFLMSYLSQEEWILYCPQFVQALKWDIHDDNALIRVLFLIALKSSEFAYRLYWQLQSNCGNPVFRRRFQHYLKVLLMITETIHLAIGSEYFLLRQLMNIAEKIKTVTTGSTRNSSLISQLKAISFGSSFSLPLYHDLFLSDVNWARCKVMDSKKLPLFLSFVVKKPDPIGDYFGNTSYSERDEINILVKKGDDLRKDEIICNMIFILGQLLEANGIPNHFQHYACMTTGHEEGLIEIVDHSVTLGSIYSHHSQTSKNSEHTIQHKINTAKRLLLHHFVIQEYLITHSSLRTRSLVKQRQEMEDRLRLNTARILTSSQSQKSGEVNEDESIEMMSRRFAASLGQYLMFVYLFGIGDRHNDNVMLNAKGYFHIDFGHILGHYKHKFGIARETHSFLFTRAYYNVLGGENHPNFKLFMENALACYRVVRANVYLFYSMFELLRESGVDEVEGEKDTQFLLNACRLDLDEASAEAFMKREILRAVNSILPIINDFFHILRHA